MKKRSLIIRIWLKEDEEISGIVSDPVQQRQQSFQGELELQRLVAGYLAELRQQNEDQPPLDSSLAN